MIRRQLRLEFFLKFCCCLFPMVVLPCSFIQVPLAFDIGILQMVRPGAQLSGTTFGNGFEV
jgi:hypothetical protein